MRFVAAKSETQLSMQSMHRHRSKLVGYATRLINQARGFSLERRIAISQGRYRIDARVPEILEDVDNGLPDETRALLAEMLAEWDELEGRIEAMNHQLVAAVKQRETCVRLREVPGTEAPSPADVTGGYPCSGNATLSIPILGR